MIVEALIMAAACLCGVALGATITHRTSRGQTPLPKIVPSRRIVESTLETPAKPDERFKA